MQHGDDEEEGEGEDETDSEEETNTVGEGLAITSALAASGSDPEHPLHKPTVAVLKRCFAGVARRLNRLSHTLGPAAGLKWACLGTAKLILENGKWRACDKALSVAYADPADLEEEDSLAFFAQHGPKHFTSIPKLNQAIRKLVKLRVATEHEGSSVGRLYAKFSRPCWWPAGKPWDALAINALDRC
ncbi:hypothetical protein WJX72_002554 [[Myrmecia] bisecta]|uniref:Uncharacterized protein n=1 Tax=[Myrmecia] bisecta TaxID=41462 RepID=A0AAW1Q6Q1_9CHLO